MATDIFRAPAKAARTTVCETVSALKRTPTGQKAKLFAVANAPIGLPIENQPTNHTTQHGFAQDSIPGETRGLRFVILLLDSVDEHAARIRQVCESRHHEVIVHTANISGVDLDRLVPSVDVVAVNMTLDRPSDWRLLARVCGMRSPASMRPGVLSLSSVYRGPEPRLRAERLGSRFVYD